MSKKYDVVATVGTYKDSKTGEERRRYQNCGAVFETDKGLSLKLEAVPVGEWNGWFNLYEPKPRGQKPQNRAPSENTPPPFNDDDLPNFDEEPF